MFGIYKNQGSVSQSVGYNSYVANLTQEGTNAPVPTVLYNDLGTTLSGFYDNTGSYYLQAGSNIFIANKTAVIINQTSTDIVFAQKDPNSTNKILIGAVGDDILNGTIEIRVYI